MCDSTDKGRRRVVLYDANGKTIEVGEQVEEKETATSPVFDAMDSASARHLRVHLKEPSSGSVEYRLTVRGSRKTAMGRQAGRHRHQLRVTIPF